MNNDKINELFEKVPISISIIDYLGKIENGVGLLLSMVSGNETYEIGYWFNREGKFRIIPDDKLLKKLNLEDIYEFEYIKEFVYFIHNSLKNPDDILNEFLKE